MCQLCSRYHAMNNLEQSNCSTAIEKSYLPHVQDAAAVPIVFRWCIHNGIQTIIRCFPTETLHTSSTDLHTRSLIAWMVLILGAFFYRAILTCIFDQWSKSVLVLVEAKQSMAKVVSTLWVSSVRWNETALDFRKLVRFSCVIIQCFTSNSANNSIRLCIEIFIFDLSHQLLSVTVVLLLLAVLSRVVSLILIHRFSTPAL